MANSFTVREATKGKQWLITELASERKISVVGQEPLNVLNALVTLKSPNRVFSYYSFLILAKNEGISSFKVYQNLFSFVFYDPI